MTSGDDAERAAVAAADALLSDPAVTDQFAAAAERLSQTTGLPGPVASALLSTKLAETLHEAARAAIADARSRDVTWQVIADAFGVAVSTAYARFTAQGRRDNARRQRQRRARQQGE